MRTLFLIALITCLVSPLGAQVRPPIFNQPITIKAIRIRIDSLLQTFSRQTGVEFSFSTNRISPAKSITVPRQRQSLAQWLTTLQQQVQIGHKVVGNHIILFEQPPTTNVPKPNTAHTTSKTKGKQSKISTQASPGKATNRIDSSKLHNADSATHRRVESNSKPAAETPVAAVRPEAASTTIPIPASAQTAKPTSSSLTGAAVAPAGQPVPPAPTKRKPVIAAPASNAGERPVEVDAGDNDESRMIVLLGGYGRHASGDLNGYIFGGEYAFYLRRRFSFALNVRGSLHREKNYFLTTHPTNYSQVQGFVHFTTLGGQIGIDTRYSLVRSNHHEVLVSLGPFGRYQSTYKTGHTLLTPGLTEWPDWIPTSDYWRTQNFLTIGVLFQLQYHYTFRNKWVAGIKAGIQGDSEGELLPQAVLSIGKRF